jgi:hypothetical protein
MEIIATSITHYLGIAPVMYQDISTHVPQRLQLCIKTPVHVSLRGSSHVSRHQYTCPSVAAVVKTPVHVSLSGSRYRFTFIFTYFSWPCASVKAYVHVTNYAKHRTCDHKHVYTEIMMFSVMSRIEIDRCNAQCCHYIILQHEWYSRCVAFATEFLQNLEPATQMGKSQFSTTLMTSG